MPRFRKLPVEIEAVQFTGTNHDEIVAFCPQAQADSLFPTIILPTLEGQHVASAGDWIIRGVKGEFYPCKPEIFKLTYEPVCPLCREGLPRYEYDGAWGHYRDGVFAGLCVEEGGVKVK